MISRQYCWGKNNLLIMMLERKETKEENCIISWVYLNIYFKGFFHSPGLEVKIYAFIAGGVRLGCQVMQSKIIIIISIYFKFIFIFLNIWINFVKRSLEKSYIITDMFNSLLWFYLIYFIFPLLIFWYV